MSHDQYSRERDHLDCRMVTILRIITTGTTTEAIAHLPNGRRSRAWGATPEQAKARLHSRLLRLREAIDEALLALDCPPPGRIDDLLLTPERPSTRSGVRAAGSRLPQGVPA
jgi:hypothetical protein